MYKDFRSTMGLELGPPFFLKGVRSTAFGATILKVKNQGCSYPLIQNFAGFAVNVKQFVPIRSI
jgi:hypothetical protein